MFVYEEVNHANPYALPEELEFLRQEAFKLGPSSQIMMLGCGPGVMSVAMLEGHPNPPNIAIVDLTSFYYCEAHLRGAGVDYSRVQFITGDSSSIGDQWWHIPVDLLIVDGDHSFSGCRKDIQGWWQHVKPGGLVFFHDAKERVGGFNGSGPWERGPVSMAIDSCRDSSWLKIAEVGISLVYMKV